MLKAVKALYILQNQTNPNLLNLMFCLQGIKEVVDILLDLFLRKEDYNDTVFLRMTSQSFI